MVDRTVCFRQIQMFSKQSNEIFNNQQKNSFFTSKWKEKSQVSVAIQRKPYDLSVKSHKMRQNDPTRCSRVLKKYFNWFIHLKEC